MGFGPSDPATNQGMGSPYGGGPMGPLRVETQRRVGVLVLLITTLMAGLFLSTTCPSSRGRRAVYATSISAAPASGRVSVAANEGASWAAFVRTARVIEPGSPAAVGEGEMCAIEVTPVDSGPFDCRVVVRCDDHVLYGEVPDSGFNFCGPVPSRIVDGNVRATFLASPVHYSPVANKIRMGMTAHLGTDMQIQQNDALNGRTPFHARD